MAKVTYIAVSCFRRNSLRLSNMISPKRFVLMTISPKGRVGELVVIPLALLSVRLNGRWWSLSQPFIFHTTVRAFALQVILWISDMLGNKFSVM